MLDLNVKVHQNTKKKKQIDQVAQKYSYLQFLRCAANGKSFEGRIRPFTFIRSVLLVPFFLIWSASLSIEGAFDPSLRGCFLTHYLTQDTLRNPQKPLIIFIHPYVANRTEKVKTAVAYNNSSFENLLGAILISIAECRDLFCIHIEEYEGKEIQSYPSDLVPSRVWCTECLGQNIGSRSTFDRVDLLN